MYFIDTKGKSREVVRKGRISFGICSEGINVWLINNRGIISKKLIENYKLLIVNFIIVLKRSTRLWL